MTPPPICNPWHEVDAALPLGGPHAWLLPKGRYSAMWRVRLAIWLLRAQVWVCLVLVWVLERHRARQLARSRRGDPWR